ncbi:putative adipose-regulatory protein-domain-containing protein [Peziza echinospora]|nr:putative adipose-regulatory protein-domain-containing protein [Peziza echinospora]
MDILLRPLRIAKSRSAQKAYITTILFSISALVLLGIAAFSYLLFYLNYIPKIGVDKQVFLEYGYLPNNNNNNNNNLFQQYDFPQSSQPRFHPPGFNYKWESVHDKLNSQNAILGGGGARKYEFPRGQVGIEKGEVISGQEYDVFVKLVLPTSPVNRGLGNFMVELEVWGAALVAPPPPPPPTYPSSKDSKKKVKTVDDGKSSAEKVSEEEGNKTPPPPPPQPQNPLLHKSTRPVILPYHSPFPSGIRTFLATPLYLLNLAREEEVITIKLLSDITFPGKLALPEFVRVTVRNERVESYDVSIQIRAKLSGWRRVMYEWRILAFLVGTAVFWGVEVVWMVGVWWVLVARRGGSVGGEEEKEEKEEKDKAKAVGGGSGGRVSRRKKGTGAATLPSAEGTAAAAGESSLGEDTLDDEDDSALSDTNNNAYGNEDDEGDSGVDDIVSAATVAASRRSSSRRGGVGQQATPSSSSSSSARHFPPQTTTSAAPLSARQPPGIGRGRQSQSQSQSTGRSGYLPSPSPTPTPYSPQPAAQVVPLPPPPHAESVREGYAADEDTTTADDELGGVGGTGPAGIARDEEEEDDDEVDEEGYLDASGVNVDGEGGEAAAATGVLRPGSAAGGRAGGGGGGDVHRRR